MREFETAIDAWLAMFVCSIMLVMIVGGGASTVASVVIFVKTSQLAMVAATLGSLICCAVGVIGWRALPQRTDL